MRHPYKKIILTELFSIVFAILIGMVALIKGYLILIFISLYLVTLSLFCQALMEWSIHQKTLAGKQVILAFMLFCLTTYLIFQL